MTESTITKSKSVSIIPDTIPRWLPVETVDKVIFLYLLYIPLLVLAFGASNESYIDIYKYNTLVTLGVLALIWASTRSQHWSVLTLRAIYPALLFTFFYTQTGALVDLLTPGFLDWHIVEFEKMALGINPTLWTDRNFIGQPGAVWVTEILSMSYFSYYLMFPAVIIPLLVKKRYGLVHEYLLLCAITFFVSYNLFWIYPLEGPRWFFVESYQNQVTGPIFRNLVELVMGNAAIRGGCMPSTHAGVGLVTVVFLYRHYRRWFPLGLALLIGLSLGAVYGRFHYATDIVVGLSIAGVCVYAVTKFKPGWLSLSERSMMAPTSTNIRHQL
ncbi:MAG: phosphatase PAP2 family protein [candidate division Zixibacteria bacterium]|nr:phosphatase PAP2 family protein [candidate division Zixibacteria bacterium]